MIKVYSCIFLPTMWLKPMHECPKPNCVYSFWITPLILIFTICQTLLPTVTLLFIVPFVLWLHLLLNMVMSLSCSILLKPFWKPKWLNLVNLRKYNPAFWNLPYHLLIIFSVCSCFSVISLNKYSMTFWIMDVKLIKYIMFWLCVVYIKIFYWAKTF